MTREAHVATTHPIPVDDNEIALHEVPGGEGTPVLLVHGATSGAWHFLQRWAPRLAQSRPVYAVDLRGHGESTGGDRLDDATLADFAADVRAALTVARHRTGRTPVLMGHSMGSVVSRLVAAESEVAGLGLLGFGSASASMKAFMWWTMTRFPWMTFKGMLTGDIGAVFQHRRPQHAMMFHEEPLEEVLPFVDRLRTQPESSAVFQDMARVELGPPKTPAVLLLAGEHDPLVPRRAFETLSRDLGVRGQRVPGAAHDLMLGRASARALDVVEAWLRTIDRPSDAPAGDETLDRPESAEA